MSAVKIYGSIVSFTKHGNALRRDNQKLMFLWEFWKLFLWPLVFPLLCGFSSIVLLQSFFWKYWLLRYMLEKPNNRIMFICFNVFKKYCFHCKLQKNVLERFSAKSPKSCIFLSFWEVPGKVQYSNFQPKLANMSIWKIATLKRIEEKP